jgi:hypothetical protein
LAVLAEGSRRRAGLGLDQPAGAMAATLAGWFLAMAAVLAGGAMLFGEWFAWLPSGWAGGTFGPFTTDGAPVYLAVLLAAAAWGIGQRRAAQVLVVTALVLALAMLAVEPFVRSWARPSLSFVLPLLVFALPSLVRPGPGPRLGPRRRREVRALAATATLAACVDMVAVALPRQSVLSVLAKQPLEYRWGNVTFVFYRAALPDVAHWVVLCGVACALAVGALAIADRAATATSVAGIAAPWLLFAGLVLLGNENGHKWARAAFVLLAALVAMTAGLWARRRQGPAMLAGPQPASGTAP